MISNVVGVLNNCVKKQPAYYLDFKVTYWICVQIIQFFKLNTFGKALIFTRIKTVFVQLF